MILIMNHPESVSKTDLAYCAGIIDGEGTVGIYRRPNRRTFRIAVRVAMCEPQAVDLLHHIFGGFKSLKAVPRRGRPWHRPIHEWACAAKIASACLRTLLPFLRVKRAQALNALRLQELNTKIRASTTVQRANRKGFGPANKGAFVIAPADMAECEALYQAQRALNHRGIRPKDVAA